MAHSWQDLWRSEVLFLQNCETLVFDGECTRYLHTKASRPVQEDQSTLENPQKFFLEQINRPTVPPLIVRHQCPVTGLVTQHGQPKGDAYIAHDASGDTMDVPGSDILVTGRRQWRSRCLHSHTTTCAPSHYHGDCRQCLPAAG